MSDVHRLHRIAELLCKAILLTEASRAVNLPSRAASDRPTASVFPDPSGASDAERILNLIQFVGGTSPAAIRSTLGLSRVGTYRILHQLKAAGRIVASGQTRMLVYRLNRDEPSPEQIGLN
jgi:uncharacterized membrane protein